MIAMVYVNLNKTQIDDVKKVADELAPFYDKVILGLHRDDEAPPLSVVPLPSNNDAHHQHGHTH